MRASTSGRCGEGLVQLASYLRIEERQELERPPGSVGRSLVVEEVNVTDGSGLGEA